MSKREIKIYFDEEKEDVPFPELIDYGNIIYTPQKLEDINKGEADISINGGNRAISGLTAAGFVQRVIQGANITGTPAIGVNISNTHIGYFDGTTWPVFIRNDGRFMFQGDTGNFITWDGAVLNIRGQLSADDITAGTLTGRTIRTAATGLRTELVTIGTFAHALEFYDSANAKRGVAYIIENQGLLLQGSPDMIISTVVLRPIIDAIIDLGSPTFRWRNLWLSNQLTVADHAFIFGDLVTDRIYPNEHNTKLLGLSTRKWHTAHYTNRGTCDLPTSQNAIKVLKKIKPCKMKKGLHGKRHYFEDDKDFPDELKFTNEEGKREMELTRVTGVMLGAVKELIEKVEILEKKC